MMYRRIKIDPKTHPFPDDVDEVTWRGITFKKSPGDVRNRGVGGFPHNVFYLGISPSSCHYATLLLCEVVDGFVVREFSATFDLLEVLGVNVFRTEKVSDAEITFIARNGECQLAIPDGYSLEDGKYKVTLVKQ